MTITTIEKFEVRNRWTGKVSFTAEIECEATATYGWKLRLAVAWALAASIPMSDLNLDRVDFTNFECPVGSRFDGSRFDGSSFVGSSFDGSRFDGSSFVGSSFDGSSFDGSIFDGSSFVGSSFVRSSFVGSSFDGSRFDGSRFVGSRFDGSSFDGSSFVGSIFDGSSFVGSSFVRSSDAKSAFLKIIAAAEAEIPALRLALCEGRVNGSTYSGTCACLVGTIANARGCDYTTLPHDPDNAAERWFLMISIGDVPGDGSPGAIASRHAVEWIDEYLATKAVAVKGKAK